jgi:predicted secreted hydrolase
MTGSGGRDRLSASGIADPASPTPGILGIDLTLAARKPPALHDRIGWIDFAAGGSSYYYSRTSMAATGSVVVDGRTLPVTGDAWFDHQWGDFIAVGGGGWDWFAVNLDDGTDLTLSLVRNADGSYPLVYGTLVDANGAAHHLPREAFDVAVTGRWTSPRTGAVYPAGWRVTIPGDDLVIDLTPAVADQELDTRATTGVVYWEGSQRVAATRGGRSLRGEAYVELTGYASAAPPSGPESSAGPVLLPAPAGG